MKNLISGVILLLCLQSVDCWAVKQEEKTRAAQVHPFVWKAFPLSEVHLTDSYFKAAMDRNQTYLLSLEVDRLIPHVRKNAGLQPKGKNYGGWESGGGCTYGHYMSACAMLYAATGNPLLKERLDYIVSELKACQDKTQRGWFMTGNHVLEAYERLQKGELLLNRPDESGQPWNCNQAGNSWYGIHKVLAGLRDAYCYAGNETAKSMLFHLADIISEFALNSNPDLFQGMLSVEQGGMNEILADVYALSGQKKYLDAAQRFNHINVIYPLANGEDVLAGRHANDQIPKFVGVAREYEFLDNELLKKAAVNFWHIVTQQHSYVIGGNSCCERFGRPGETGQRLDFTTAETCNTYNMLKLSRQLFMLTGDYRYLNYYERALYNHILASQDPEMPGCVTYYTTLMPGGMKQYSTPYDSFWCCVGTGLENHTKYGESVFFHNDSDLLVNLFIPVQLEWQEKGMQLSLVTHFPESDTIQIRIEHAGTFDGALFFRYPEWLKKNPQVMLNGQYIPVDVVAQEYIRLDGPLKTGDEIQLIYPRTLYTEYVEKRCHFGSVVYGPLVLAGGLGQKGEIEDRVSDSRTFMTRVPVKDIPALVGPFYDLESWIVPETSHPLKFRVKNGGDENAVELIPFFQMHHQPYTVYWEMYTPEEYKYRNQVVTDAVAIDMPEDEAKHHLKGERDSLYWHDFFWAKNRQYRMAEKGGWFAYQLRIDPKEKKVYSLVCQFWGDESPEHEFEIWVEDHLLTEVNLNRRNILTYVEDVYEIPKAWTQGKSRIQVTFRAKPGKYAGGLYDLKITADPNFR